MQLCQTLVWYSVWKEKEERNKEERTTMIENKKLAMKEKELQVKENIANKQLQIAKENKNKYDSKKTK